MTEKKKTVKKCKKCKMPASVKVKLLNSDAKMPTRGKYQGDVGYDIYAVEDCEIPFGTCKDVPTGIAIQPPKGYYCTVETRSKTGRAGHTVHRGIIDPGYTGEITVFVRNATTSSNVKTSKIIKKGEKIAQLTFHKAFYAEFDVVDELETTERGGNSCGSSDK